MVETPYFSLPKYETTLVTDRRIYSTDQPIRSHIILKQHYRIPQATYDHALHAVYYPGSDFLSLTEDAVYNAGGGKFERLYDFLKAKYPGFGMQTRVRQGMWGSEEKVGDLMRRYATTEEHVHEVSGFSEELRRYHGRRPIRVREHRRQIQ